MILSLGRFDRAHVGNDSTRLHGLCGSLGEQDLFDDGAIFEHDDHDVGFPNRFGRRSCDPCA